MRLQRRWQGTHPIVRRHRNHHHQRSVRVEGMATCPKEHNVQFNAVQSFQAFSYLISSYTSENFLHTSVSGVFKSFNGLFIGVTEAKNKHADGQESVNLETLKASRLAHFLPSHHRRDFQQRRPHQYPKDLTNQVRPVARPEPLSWARKILVQRPANLEDPDFLRVRRDPWLSSRANTRDVWHVVFRLAAP